MHAPITIVTIVAVVVVIVVVVVVPWTPFDAYGWAQKRDFAKISTYSRGTTLRKPTETKIGVYVAL